jgi:hypothetical protein
MKNPFKTEEYRVRAFILNRINGRDVWSTHFSKYYSDKEAAQRKHDEISAEWKIEINRGTFLLEPLEV